MPIVTLKQQLEDLLHEAVDVAPVALLKPDVAASALAEAVPL
jgi:predicted nucleotidyltransferase